MGVQMHSHAISASCLLCIAACLFDPLPSILAPLGGGRDGGRYISQNVSCFTSHSVITGFLEVRVPVSP